MIFNLYVVNDDGSKSLLSSYQSLDEAKSGMVDERIIYSIEAWDGNFATVIQ